MRHKAHLKFQLNDEELSRFAKSYKGVVGNPGQSYTIQEMFHSEGYFYVKVTPLGANLFA